MSIITPFKLDFEKALSVILYIANRSPIPDIFHVLKILYFADRIHLERYGRTICGDNYIAMDKGPVPSGSYDIIKYVRGDGWGMPMIEKAKKLFSIKGDNIIIYEDADLELLSDSDMKCLNESIKDNGNLSFNRLKKKSHNDAAYKLANKNSEIPLDTIVKTLANPEELMDYIYNGN